MYDTFSTPQRLCKYDNKTFRYVFNGDIKPGDVLVYGSDNEGKHLSAPVKEIVEKRPSKGEFKNGVVPYSYKVVLE